MIPQPNSLIIVSLLEKHAEQSEFARATWPPHITIVAWFSLDDVDALTQSLEAFAQQQTPFSTSLGRQDFFGPNKDIPVNIFPDQNQLEMLHADLFHRVAHLGAQFQEQEFMGENYRAHVTRMKARLHQLEEGEVVTIDNVCLARLTNPSSCKILQTFIFGALDETTT